jgi:16S rRNA (cytidine1402-2'-O)-methyltransferase
VRGTLNNQKKGTLYIVATPIGNLEDITYRAVRILREVDLIAAEDTRHSRKLLSHFGISNPLTSYFDHNKHLKGTVLLGKLMQGLSVALISDAGTPCISDPGYLLVRNAVELGIPVVPIPGPSAALAALSASGLQTDSFVFEGFLPNRQGKRRNKLLAIKEEERVIIFYESPNRLQATLLDILQILGDREAVIAREITKIYEEFTRGVVSQLITEYEKRQVKGEIVILVAPGENRTTTKEVSIPDLLDKFMGGDKLSLKDAVKRIAVETGIARTTVYIEALRLSGLNRAGSDDE